MTILANTLTACQPSLNGLVNTIIIRTFHHCAYAFGHIFFYFFPSSIFIYFVHCTASDKSDAAAQFPATFGLARALQPMGWACLEQWHAARH